MTTDWQRVGRRITERIEELSLDRTEVVRRSGPEGDQVSTTSLRKYMAGEPITRPAKKRQLARALGWTPESFDLIARGGEPVAAPGWGTDPHGSPLPDGPASDGLEDRVGALEGEVARLAGTVEALTADVRTALQAVREPGRPGRAPRR